MSGSGAPNPPPIPVDDDVIEHLLQIPESDDVEFKRVGDNVRKLQTIVALSNTRGGILVLGIEDEDKATGRDRVHGIQENPASVDELVRLIGHRITPALTPPDFAAPVFREIGCTLRDGRTGSIFVVRVEKSVGVHSLVDGGTYVRMSRTNRQISAAEITDLSMQRGIRSWVAGLADVSIDLIETSAWREYAGARRLTRPTPEALRHLGLARTDPDGQLRPTRAAILLFAEDPGGLLDSKCGIRVFQYRGDRIEHTPETNLLRPVRTIAGPLLMQIRDASNATLEALATGIQMGPLGFEVVQSYPVRVLREAITNAVIHRDYRLQADIQIRIFANRVEVESPGLFPADVTVANIGRIGSRPRNRALVDHLREFPTPPNLDAGEGVRMMFQTMLQASLYPPLYLTQPDWSREAVLVVCFNEARADTWTQVEHYLSTHADIGNSEIRQLLGTDRSGQGVTFAQTMGRPWPSRGRQPGGGEAGSTLSSARSAADTGLVFNPVRKTS
jgi:ATP-dependent DNA helicase RecG